MQILITNDDGIFSPGLYALAAEMCRDHEVVVVAPNAERSGAAHSFTLTTPLRAEETSLAGLPVRAYAVNGTPVDCVKLGCGNLDVTPDLILSGINLGANLGTDAFYSGTVSAAIEGGLLGIPSMAVSVNSFTPEDFAPAAHIARSLIPRLLRGECKVINLNVPDLPEALIKGCRFTASSRQVYDEVYVERRDPHNRRYFWIPTAKLTQHETNEDTDGRWVGSGYAAAVPILLDLTDHACLARWRDET